MVHQKRRPIDDLIMDWSHQTVIVVILEVFTDWVGFELYTLLNFLSNLLAVYLKITQLQAAQNFCKPLRVDVLTKFLNDVQYLTDFIDVFAGILGSDFVLFACR